MERLPDGVDSKFRYVLLVAKRAEQLIQGAAPKQRSRHAKSTRVAMDEVNNRLIQWRFDAPIEPTLDLEETPVEEAE